MLFDWAPAKRFLYRGGRRLYYRARGEVINRFDRNGEDCLQKAALRIFAAKDEATVLDIGANLGEWSQSMLETLRMAKDAGSCRARLNLHLFEPTPVYVRSLEKRFGAPVDGARLKVWPLAVAAEDGEATFHIRAAGGGVNSLGVRSTAEATERVNVGLVCLETMHERLGRPHFDLIKSDVEGYDLAVIKGARRLLEREAVSVLQFEYNYLWVLTRTYLRDAFELVKGLNYRIGRLEHHRIVVFDDWHPELERFIEGNYAVMHEPLIARLGGVPGRFDASNTLVVGR